MAIKFEKIQPGMTLYDVSKETGFTRWKWAIWPVVVHEINIEERRVFASWNGNKPEWMSEHRITKYRLKPPQQVYYR